MTVGWWVEFFADVTLTADAELAFAAGGVDTGTGFILTAAPQLTFVAAESAVSAAFTLTSDASLELVASAAIGAAFGLTAAPQLGFAAEGNDGWFPGDEDGVTTLPHKVPFTLP